MAERSGNLFPEIGAPLEPWDRCWVPAGREVTVGGRRIPGGMLYVGSTLQAALWRGLEPALVDPGLPCRVKNPDRTGALAGGLNPYHALPPASRAALLEWLAGGRCAPDAYLGYVAFFFSGIERRVLYDAGRSAAARGEVGELLAEVERLLGIYGHHPELGRRLASFLVLARLLMQPAVEIEALEPLFAFQAGDADLFALRAGLAILAAAKRPIPPRWALEWFQSLPEARLRTQERRYPEEFRELFAIRYREAFPPDGLRLKWRPKSPRRPLTLQYLPVSSTFGGLLRHTARALPDVFRYGQTLRRLQEVADRVCDELDPYSRRVGMTGEGSSPAALGRLPPALRQSRGSAGPSAADPVTVRLATAGPAGFALPDEPVPAGLVLDLRKIEAKLAETERVASLLDEVFTGEGASVAAPVPETPAGLDAAHAALLRELAVSPTWDRADVERLAADLGLLPDGALEALNEAAFARCGAPLLEEDEMIEIDTEILESLRA